MSNLDELAIKVAQKDEEAFSLLYEETRRAVFAVCLGVLRERDLAEEITQDVYVAVYLESASFSGKGYKTWILTIARNKALNALKKRKRETPVDFNAPENEYRLTAPSAEDDTSGVLDAALEKLAPLEREITLLKAAGLKTKEIAETLRIPRGTISWKYNEALKKLKSILENER